jgi:hypothetical protein
VAAAVAAGKARLATVFAIFAGGTALGAGAAPSAFDFGGRYMHSFRNGTVDGESFISTDIVTIVATDARHAVFDMELAFFNGHQCSISGPAVLDGNALVYRDPEMTNYGEGGICTLRIRQQGRRLTWDDRGTCTGYCGARGSLRGGGIALSSRRPMSRTERRRFLSDHGGNGS